MNQSSEIDQPYEGQKFTSFDALKKYLEEYGQKNFVKFWIRSSHTRNSLKSRTSKTMNPDLKYVSVKFACIFGGEKIRCRGSGIRKSSTYRNLGCPCMINAVVGDDGNHVKLDTVILEHNHVLCKTLYDSLKKTKRKSLRISKDLAEINVQDLNLGENQISYSSASQNEKYEEEELNEMEKYEDENVESTENCLKSIKDKYGRNVKILVVNSENVDEINSESKEYETKEVEYSDEETKDSPKNNSEICRLCLSSKEKLSPIFNPDLPLKSTVLSFKIMGCASIEISSDDGLPNNICATCEANLDIAYNFRVRCEDSDSILRKAYMRNYMVLSAENINGDLKKLLEEEISNEENSIQDALVNYQKIGEENEEAEEMNVASTQDSLYVQFAISCPVCGCNFDTFESMLEHLDTHEDDDGLLFACNICSVICSSTKKLQEHMGEHLKESRALCACGQCEMTFASAEELKLHEESHAQGKKQQEVNYLCNVCGKILKSKDRFQSHKNIHEGLRPHVCLKCGRGFADRKNMHQHYDVVHLRRTKHECPVCQKKFYTRTKMKSHLTMHYGVKPFTCDVCNKTFRLKMNMIKHKKTHSKDRPHQCDKCNAAFIDKNMLKRHSYIHGGIRPYPCPVCGHRFSVKFHLKKHLEKSKCGGAAVVNSESYRWVDLAHPDSNLTEAGECVVLYKTNGENVLQTKGETVTINMDILPEFEKANS